MEVPLGSVVKIPLKRFSCSPGDSQKPRSAIFKLCRLTLEFWRSYSGGSPTDDAAA
jgi:hypothetical protein